MSVSSLTPLPVYLRKHTSNTYIQQSAEHIYQRNVYRTGSHITHTPKAVTYHKQSHYCRFMIGHSLGRMEAVNIGGVQCAGDGSTLGEYGARETGR